MYVYLNGVFMPRNEAAISPLDHGFLYGMGVFETIRTYNGVPFLLEEHIHRLNRGLEELRINYTFEVEHARKIITGLCRKNELPHASVRLNISAGEGSLGPQAEAYDKPAVFAFMRGLQPPEEIVEKEAILLNLRRNTPETGIRLKSHHYFNNIAAKREVGSDPAKEGLFLTSEGFVAEGIVSNVFWVKAGIVYTPSLETGILIGITRMFLLNRLHALSIPVQEGVYSFSELAAADEIFFTNSVQEIVAVKTFENKVYPGRDGEVVSLLYREYRQATDLLNG